MTDSYKFTAFGIVMMGILLWLAGVNGSPGTRKIVNWFLFVLLASIIILRFDVIRPLFFKIVPQKGAG